MRQGGEACRLEGIQLIPMPYETLGGAHSTTITKIGRALAAHLERLEGEVLSHLFQCLGVLLAKGNSVLLLSRPPRLIPPSLDGDRGDTGSTTTQP